MANKLLKAELIGGVRTAMLELEKIKKAKVQLDAQQAEIEKWLVSVCATQENGKTSFVDSEGKELASVTNSYSYKVNGDLVDKIAKEHRMEDQVSLLFRFKAELNAANWNGADEAVRVAFSEAVTAKADKPKVSSTALEEAVKSFKKSM